MRTILLSLVTVVGVTLDAPPLLASPDVFVNAGAPCAGADGTAAAPFCTIGEALQAAAPGDRVVVAPGLYVERLVVDRDVRIVGTGGPDVTVVDGNFEGTVLRIEPLVTATVEGLTLSRGRLGVFCGGGLTLRRCVVCDNASASGLFLPPIVVGILGGGTGPLVLEATRVENNRELGFYSTTDTAGLSVTGTSPLVIRDCVFTGNRGNGISTLRVNCPALIEGSTFEADSSSFLAVQLLGTTRVVNCTFDTGERIVRASNTEFSGCTLTGNLVRLPGSGPVRLAGTILANPITSADGVFVSDGHNLVTASQSASGFGPDDLVGFFGAPIDAGLLPLADNGGPTPTMALAPGSAAVGAGDPTSFEVVDQRGRLRTSGSVDIGAFQSTSLAVGFGVAGCPGTVNGGGSIARTFVLGSPTIADDDVTLAALGVTPDQFGIFVASRDVATTPVSGGILCLGGSIGRLVLPGQIRSSGAQGRLSLPLDLAAIPEGATFAAAQPGETWRFQCWFRDTLAEASFGTATEVTFQ